MKMEVNVEPVDEDMNDMIEDEDDMWNKES